MIRRFLRILCAPLRWCNFLVVWVLKLPILAYRRWISPKKGQGSCCYLPTCSQYALDALRLWGVLGVFLAAWRILRCNPFSRGGFDPVPLPPWQKKRTERTAETGTESTTEGKTE